MLSKIIGIISYLPDNSLIREVRKVKLQKLIYDCNRLFNLPIMIIAQNYTEKEIWELKSIYPNILIKDYVVKLGITGARKTLRKEFLNSDYDYLIMLDDDIELTGTSGEKYLAQIDANPNCFIENNRSRLQLFAISKYILNQHDFEDIEAERAEGFEDRIFFYTLCKKFPQAHKKFVNTGIIEKAIATGDRNSTWYKNQDLKSMLQKTTEMINKLA